MTAISLTTPRLCPSSVDTGERGTEPVKALSGLALASYTQSRVGKTEDKNWDPFEFSLSLSLSPPTYRATEFVIVTSVLYQGDDTDTTTMAASGRY